MNLITLDFETYYAPDFSLTKLTTEEYIKSPQFQVIGVGVKVNDGETVWASGDGVKSLFQSLDWGNSLLLCHNTIFDGAILAWHYGIVPHIYLDTLSMARAIHGVDAGGSLAKLVERYNLGQKGAEVLNALGKRLEDFSTTDLKQYGEYCKNDTELTYKLWNILSTEFSVDELQLIDMTIRMFTEPQLEIDDALLVDRLEEVQQEKSLLLRGLMARLECDTEEAVRKKLASNKQFAELLQEFGVTVPMKKSPATGEQTYALAKNDVGFIELTEHEDPFIQQLCAVRLGTKSTIEESRIQRFIGIGARNKGRLPIPLKYYGAHTGRWAGSDKVNFQNLPSRDKKKKALKNAVVAPMGKVVINCDSSQIEARVLVWVAGQENVVQMFAEGRDVYSEFASIVYNKKITKENPVERFVGKTCIAEGTPVLCESGWKPIETVTINDKIWDGQEWVCHQGLLKNGLKETLNLCGSWLTPDHLVWSGIEWLEAQSIKQDSNTLSQALAFAVENLPLQAMLRENAEELNHSLLNVTVMKMNTQLTHITSKLSKVQDVMYVQSKRLIKSVIGFIQRPFQMTPTELDFLTDSQPQSRDATWNLVNIMSTMGKGVSTYMKGGVKTELSFCAIYKHVKGGITQNTKWIGLIIIKGMNHITSGLCRLVTTQKINVESPNLKPVYDILNSGSRNRFTILTDRGALIVHNCTLGLGYGTGWAKLQHTLKTSPPGADLPDDECQRLVKVYRDFNYEVINLWKEADGALGDMAVWPKNKKPYYLGKHECLLVTPDGIKLPNGLYIRYPELKWDTSEAKSKYTYKSRKGHVAIWGGSVVENVIQALARIIVGEQMIKIGEKYHPALTVHDAAVIVAPSPEAEQAMEYVMSVMNTPPVWGSSLPVACEAGMGESYGEC